jgi:Flp pilus assembly pilin Flp
VRVGSRRFDTKGERGQTMAEYAIVLSVITIGVIGALTAFSAQVLVGIQRVSDIVGSV